ncbi:hypothetical protein ATO6_01215 [Oceanicola sp. 22II-s10i]|uniref:hypothetical protein n=1 Tax=Oceanicola sp. 22II-s10i TaxID=1317116 RepID=UPI000B522147|nr:hypothetical protein [Oceanicola sp. 22II-s10i]OWU85584.1 hypothetical protein ATO6_01215 [Oceanicola sp. 22II-s10i]
MSDLTVTKLTFRAGVWEGLVQGGAGRPAVEAMLGDTPVAGVTLTEGPTGGHLLRVQVPSEAIGDGIQTVVIRDAADGTTLAQFAVLAGEALEDTMRAEIDLLRAELDLLKRAFRRHCVETL